jgi:hypothetical protein
MMIRFASRAGCPHSVFAGDQSGSKFPGWWPSHRERQASDLPFIEHAARKGGACGRDNARRGKPGYRPETAIREITAQESASPLRPRHTCANL